MTHFFLSKSRDFFLSIFKGQAHRWNYARIQVPIVFHSKNTGDRVLGGVTETFFFIFSTFFFVIPLQDDEKCREKSRQGGIIQQFFSHRVEGFRKHSNVSIHTGDKRSLYFLQLIVTNVNKMCYLSIFTSKVYTENSK